MSTKFMRKVELKNGEYYHVYNRGVDKRDVFLDDFDFMRFLKSARELNCIEPVGSLYEKYLREKHQLTRSGGSTSIMEVEPPISEKQLVEIIAYCLNPNHYHFILRQLEDDGIKKFMHRLGTSYTMYFNRRWKRSGALFQGRFKSCHVDSNEYLLYLSAYINKNNFIHGYTKEGEEWKYASLLDYLGKRDGSLCRKGAVLNQFNNNFDHYCEFVNINALYLKEKKGLKYTLEEL